MAELPVISGRDAVKLLTKLGFSQDRQCGSHVQMKKEGHRFVVTVPLHRELKTGTLRGIIKAAGVSVEKFFNPEG